MTVTQREKKVNNKTRFEYNISINARVKKRYSTHLVKISMSGISRRKFLFSFGVFYGPRNTN